VTQEIALLKARLAAARPTLGICLGAQMMAAALGASVYPGPSKEIGWFPLEVKQGDAFNPLAALRDIPVLHWHGDTFDLPDGCKLLASTPACRNQAFARGFNILGLQFHAEVKAARFEHWLLGQASELATSAIDPVELRSDALANGKTLEKAGVQFMTEWLARIT
jgi:GMP synthase (glutamine-hydrolysing)